MSRPHYPRRGEIWSIRLLNDEFGKCVVVSADSVNAGQIGLVIYLPCISATESHEAYVHLEVRPPDGGIDEPYIVECEKIGAAAVSRLVERQGELRPATLKRVDDKLRSILSLPR